MGLATPATPSADVRGDDADGDPVEAVSDCERGPRSAHHAHAAAPRATTGTIQTSGERLRSGSCIRFGPRWLDRSVMAVPDYSRLVGSLKTGVSAMAPWPFCG